MWLLRWRLMEVTWHSYPHQKTKPAFTWKPEFLFYAALTPQPLGCGLDFVLFVSCLILGVPGTTLKQPFFFLVMGLEPQGLVPGRQVSFSWATCPALTALLGQGMASLWERNFQTGTILTFFIAFETKKSLCPGCCYIPVLSYLVLQLPK